MKRLALSTLRAGTWHVILFLSAILLVPACNDGHDVIAPLPTVPTVAGRVVSSATGDPVAGAVVSIGTATATSGPDGRFELTDLTAGQATLRCIATGFEDFEGDITVPTGSINRDISLTRIELFEFGDFSLHVPATVSTAGGILLALGGPDTRGFVSGAPFGAPIPEVETALQALGQEFRALAASHGLAVLGTSLAAMQNGPDSDQLLLDAVQQAATLSGRPKLASAPLLLYGMSGGGPQASGFTARNPERVAGLFLKVPAGVESLTSGEVLGIPTYVVQAEMDAFVDNAALALAFEANRRAGALWALALEKGVPHHSLTPGHRGLTTNWMSTILELRLGTTPSDPLRAIGESSGWLGDPGTGEVGPWASFAGDRASASWFPSQETAERWKTFVGLPSFSVGVDPDALIVHAGWVEALTATVLDENGNSIPEPVVTFTSDTEEVATVGSDELCLPGCRHFVYVLGVAQGEATITAEYRGVTATASVTVLPAFMPAPVVGDLGVYDLTALIESFDPAWGVDMEGGFYTAVVTLSQNSTGSSEFGGKFADWRGIFPDGEFTVEPDGTGFVTGFFDSNGEVVIDVSRLGWSMRGMVLDSGDIVGTWGCCGHISGTFTAERR